MNQKATLYSFQNDALLTDSLVNDWQKVLYNKPETVVLKHIVGSDKRLPEPKKHLRIALSPSPLFSLPKYCLFWQE